MTHADFQQRVVAAADAPDNGVSLRSLTEQVASGQDLSIEDAQQAARILMTGETPEPDMEQFLVALHQKGETAEELAAFAYTMRRLAQELDIPKRDRLGAMHLGDTCGTGGSVVGGHTVTTFNVSTASAFVLAGLGCRIAKHGNRAVTSDCGSADVLEALGIAVPTEPSQVVSCLQHAGLVFLFAPQYHAATRHVMPVRKRLPHPTIFNRLGPLSNPLTPSYQVVGVNDPAALKPMARALGWLGTQCALVVHGRAADGSPAMDEVSTLGPTDVVELLPGGLTHRFVVTPESAGLVRATPTDVVGGDAQANAQRIEAILSGKDAKRSRDLVVLNAAAGVIASGRTTNWVTAVGLATQSLGSGAAWRSLEALRRHSQSPTA